MRPARPPLAVAALVAFAVGVALMIPFEATLTRLAGMIALAAFVVLGIAAIAEPGFLAADRDEDGQPEPSAPTRAGSRSRPSS